MGRFEIFVFFVALTTFVSSQDFREQFGTDSELSWTIDETKIVFTAKVKGTGWVGLGLNDKEPWTGTEVMIGGWDAMPRPTTTTRPTTAPPTTPTTQPPTTVTTQSPTTVTTQPPTTVTTQPPTTVTTQPPTTVTTQPPTTVTTQPPTTVTTQPPTTVTTQPSTTVTTQPPTTVTTQPPTTVTTQPPTTVTTQPPTTVTTQPPTTITTQPPTTTAGKFRILPLPLQNPRGEYYEKRIGSEGTDGLGGTYTGSAWTFVSASETEENEEFYTYVQWERLLETNSETDIKIVDGQRTYVYVGYGNNDDSPTTTFTNSLWKSINLRNPSNSAMGIRAGWIGMISVMLVVLFGRM